MAKRVTDKDIAELADSIATRVYLHTPEGFIKREFTGTARFDRLRELGLVQLCPIEGQSRHGWKPTEEGAKLIAPIFEERKAKAEKQKAESEAYAEKLRAKDEAFKAELHAAGIVLFERFAIWQERDRTTDKYFDSYSIDFPITCRVQYDRQNNRYFVRAAVGHSGECDTAALIAEAQQAQIACDYLNAKLKGE